MNTRLIYRVEHPTDPETGAYHSSIQYDSTTHSNERTHPTPYNDYKINRSREAYIPYYERPADYTSPYLEINFDEYCGMRTLNGLARWFKGYGQAIADKGLVVVELEVNKRDIRHGKIQVVFKRHKAKVVRVLDPTEVIGG